MSAISVTWHDSGRSPECAPNPDFPLGIDKGDAADAHMRPLANYLQIKTFIPQPLEVRTTIDQFL